MNSGRIAVIPARGGSKRVPRKNLRPFAGRPMIGSDAPTAAVSSGVGPSLMMSPRDSSGRSSATE